MIALIEWLISGGWKIAAPIIACLFGALGLYAKGRADGKNKVKRDADKAYRKTTERMQDAPRPVDADDARKRMRERKP